MCFYSGIRIRCGGDRQNILLSFSRVSQGAWEAHVSLQSDDLSNISRRAPNAIHLVCVNFAGSSLQGCLASSGRASPLFTGNRSAIIFPGASQIGVFVDDIDKRRILRSIVAAVMAMLGAGARRNWIC